MHVVMLYNFNMEFLQAFNPLYAVPIVAVIFCALIVFTFGFKSPIQPPSFEGLEEKKSVRKRKTKEIQKQSKLVTNGKANGIASGKGKIQEVPKKKETVDNSEKPNEKPKSSEKISADKKVIKKTKPKNEKPQEKKKENVVADEANDDGWVQLVSKKGKKNRKKEDSVGPDIQFTLNQSPSRKATDTNVNEVEKVSPSPSHVEVLNEAKKEMPEEKLLKKPNKKEAPISKKEAPASKKEAPVTKKEAPVTKKEAPVTKKEAPVTKKEAPVTKKEAPVSKKEAPASPEKPAKLDSTVEVKPDENLEHDLKPSTNIPTASEDTGKSKKKKKKQGAASVAVEASSIIASPPVEIEPVSKIAEAPLAPPKSSEPVVDNKPVSTPEDSKTNVVFDELAGLYPEAKEKKKKKVRRDH